MQFKKQQREQMSLNWGPQSWFYQSLGQPAQNIVGHAYGVLPCSPKVKARSQEYLTLAISIFARKCGAEKSHVVHALLTGSVDHLMNALGRLAHVRHVNNAILSEDWQDAFREVTFTVQSKS